MGRENQAEPRCESGRYVTRCSLPGESASCRRVRPCLEVAVHRHAAAILPPSCSALGAQPSFESARAHHTAHPASGVRERPREYRARRLLRSPRLATGLAAGGSTHRPPCLCTNVSLKSRSPVITLPDCCRPDSCRTRRTPRAARAPSSTVLPELPGSP